MSEQPKPCPWCGEVPDDKASWALDPKTPPSEKFMLGCHNPRCPVRPTAYARTAKAAIRRWNTRTPEPAP